MLTVLARNILWRQEFLDRPLHREEGQEPKKRLLVTLAAYIAVNHPDKKEVKVHTNYAPGDFGETVLGEFRVFKRGNTLTLVPPETADEVVLLLEEYSSLPHDEFLRMLGKSDPEIPLW